jgi:hypothetical protein
MSSADFDHFFQCFNPIFMHRVKITSLNFGQNRQNGIHDLFAVSVASAFGFAEGSKKPEVAWLKYGTL